jgi:hypothetical protein
MFIIALVMNRIPIIFKYKFLCKSCYSQLIVVILRDKIFRMLSTKIAISILILSCCFIKSQTFEIDPFFGQSMDSRVKIAFMTSQIFRTKTYNQQKEQKQIKFKHNRRKNKQQQNIINRIIYKINDTI